MYVVVEYLDDLISKIFYLLFLQIVSKLETKLYQTNIKHLST